ncbi:hypothetical protein SG34_024260 [Thalassomonas viridans]|uniref:Uncharacterized protein n=1 Tax=Thalassomonas viridans TaxID=137584 RepID=A0AAE9Z0L1_9GAMM|nr:hypothetical protein [Thalassomonas viridans]WDE04420.1 hypothetical protein SG34_024260 [Thalassomonas viridans]
MKLTLKKKNLANLSKNLNEVPNEQTGKINGGKLATSERDCDHITTHTYTVAWGDCGVEM